MKHRTIYLATLCLVLAALLLPGSADAGTSGAFAPIIGPLQEILDVLQGDVALIIGVIAVIVFGLTLAVGGGSGMMRSLVGLFFGLAIAFGGARILGSLFTPVSGLLF